MNYEQLTLIKRYRILTLIKEGHNQREIAYDIGIHPSTDPATQSFTLQIHIILGREV